LKAFRLARFGGQNGPKLQLALASRYTSPYNILVSLLGF
jgi:hypothetical protein